jgi:cytidylate kinase
MAIITISRGSNSRGKEVAESLAQRLGYDCVSREILLEASAEFNIPEIRMEKALHDAPSVLERFSHGKERYISYFCASFFNHLIKDNTVYHGLAGHFFVQGISHIMKVRILVNLEERIKEEMARQGCSADEARYTLQKDDDERRKWGLQLYGKDSWDSRLYDLVLHIDTLTVDGAVAILEQTIRNNTFKATADSLEKLKTRTLLANIQAKVVKVSPCTNVEIDDGVISLGNLEGDLKKKDKQEEIRDSIMRTYSVKDVVFEQKNKIRRVHVNPFYNLDCY